VTVLADMVVTIKKKNIEKEQGTVSVVSQVCGGRSTCVLIRTV
jgi:hypothetical protein